MRSSRPSRRILPAGLRSLLRRVFRFSIKRKQRAPKETPHPENPVCNKRPSGHKFCPDSHLHHIKYHRKWGLSSRKTSKNPFFSTFCTEKRPLTFFASHFGRSRALLGRSLSRVRTYTPSLSPVAKRDLCSNCSQKGTGTRFCVAFGRSLVRAHKRSRDINTIRLIALSDRSDWSDKSDTTVIMLALLAPGSIFRGGRLKPFRPARYGLFAAG